MSYVPGAIKRNKNDSYLVEMEKRAIVSMRLVKVHWMIYLMASKSQLKDLTSGQGQLLTWEDHDISVGASRRRQAHDNHFVSLFKFGRFFFPKKKLPTSDDLMRGWWQNTEPWSSSTASVMILNKSDWSDERHGNGMHFNFLPLIYNGEVTKTALARVADTQNLGHPCSKHWRSYHNLWVSGHSAIHCGLGRAANLPTCHCR